MHGWREMIINTQERAVSTDINRLQRFKEQDLAELFRHLLSTHAESDDDQIGVVIAPNTTGTPLNVAIAGEGFLVKPQQASLNLLVDGGVMFPLAPDAAADESNAKYIRDDGVTIAGSLVMTANASGSTRIDVIECRINGTPATVNDNRDIYNASTGLFAATSVPKERRGRLEYRVRAGTPGAGMPDNAEGWLPLCVASVPTGTTTVDTMTFWDVRPLVGDRILGLSPMSTDPKTERLNWIVDPEAAAGQSRLSGRALVTLNGQRLGGRLRRGTPGTDADHVDLTDVANHEPGFSAAAVTFTYLYLVTPFGLPRWARYTDGPSGRLPRAPRGILVVSSRAASHLSGKPSAGLTLPVSTGLGATTTTEAICIGIIGGEFAALGAGMFESSISDGREALSVGAQAAAEAGFDASGAEHIMIEGTHYPAGAKAIYVNFSVIFTQAANTWVKSAGDARIVLPGRTYYALVRSIASKHFGPNVSGSAIAVDYATELIRVPVPVGYTTWSLWHFYGLAAIAGGTLATTAPVPTLATANIAGYDMGP